MQSILKSVTDSDYSPESIRLAARGASPKMRAASVLPLDSVLGVVDRSGSVLRYGASMRAAALLYLDAVVCGKEHLAAALEKILNEKKAPELHYEMNSENALLAEFCAQIEGAEKDWDFIACSRCISNGIAWYAADKAHEYMKVADITTALNLEAIRGETGAFDDRLSSVARPFPGQIDCAYNVRKLVAGSRMTTDEGRYAYGYDTHPRVQDAICVRATPQTHGGARDICYFAEKQVAASVLEGAALYAVEYALDGLCTAIADMAHISERRTFRLNDSRLSYGLTMNLTHGDAGINHGFPVVQSNQAAFVADIKLLTLPSAAIKEPGECAAYYSSVKMLRALPLFSKVLAIELLMSCQGMDIVRDKIPEFTFGIGTAAVWSEVRRHISVMVSNRFVSPDMNEAGKLITGGEVLKAAEAAAGELR